MLCPTHEIPDTLALSALRPAFGSDGPSERIRRECRPAWSLSTLQAKPPSTLSEVVSTLSEVVSTLSEVVSTLGEAAAPSAKPQHPQRSRVNPAAGIIRGR